METGGGVTMNLDGQTSQGHGDGPSPVVSVIMANYRGARYLSASMQAVLAQSERRLELIVADDASDDDSVAIARSLARTDPRVRVIASAQNGGPGVTRNLALDAARGDWIAVVDSDDLIHPQRLSRLIEAATDAGADIVADDLVFFGAAEQAGGRTLLQGLQLASPMRLTLDLWLRGNAPGADLPSFGYLKPVIRRSVLGRRRYDPTLRIGEDYDLILRLLIDGATFLLLPDPLYAYRRHGGSVSHRLSVETVEAMLAAHEALPAIADPVARRTARTIGRDLRNALRYERLVADIKARRVGAVLPRLVQPEMLRRLAGSFIDRRRRKAAETGATPPAADMAAPPQMPPPGSDWPVAPAASAALVAARASRGEPPGLAADAPDWAAWLARAASPD